MKPLKMIRLCINHSGKMLKIHYCVKKGGYGTGGTTLTYNIEDEELLGSGGQEPGLQGSRLLEPPSGQCVSVAMVSQTAPTGFILVS